MSWFGRAQQFVAKYGKAAGFVAKHIVANAVPGGALVGDVIDSVLNVTQESAEEAKRQAEAKATRDELHQIGEMLEQCLGPLSKLCDRVSEYSGFGEEVDRFIRIQLTTQKEVQDGFRNLGVIFSCFDRLEAQNRELLRRVGYGNDLIESLMPLMKRLTDTVEFVEEMRKAGVQPGDLTRRLGTWEEIQRDIWAGQVAQAVPKLVDLDKEQPTSVCVKVSKAVGEVLSNDLLGADQTLRQAA